MKRLKKYEDAMKRYERGEFGKDSLAVQEILNRAGYPNLLQEMTLGELQCLIDRSTGILRYTLTRIKVQKLENKQNRR